MKKIAQTPRLRRMVEGDRDRMTRVYPKNEKCKRGHPYRSDGTNESIKWRCIRGKLYADCTGCKEERYQREMGSPEHKSRRRGNYSRTTELNKRMRAVVKENTLFRGKKYMVDHSTGCWYWRNIVNGEPLVQLEGSTLVNAPLWVWTVLKGPVPHGMELQPLCGVTYCVRPEHQTMRPIEEVIVQADYAAYLAEEEGL